MKLKITDWHRDWLVVEKYGGYRISVTLDNTGEQRHLIPYKQGVRGSSPLPPTNDFSILPVLPLSVPRENP